MNDTTKKPGPSTDEPTNVEDVEGHNMWIGATVASDLARSRSKELEREARDHRRAKEAKGR